MIKLPKDKHGNEGWVVKARTQHWCESRKYGCERLIEPGRHYYRGIAWPSHDANGGTAPWVMKICRACMPEALTDAFDAAIGGA